MLVRDDANPRSLAFQVKGLAEYIAKTRGEPRPLRRRRALRRRTPRLRALQPADLDPDSDLLMKTLNSCSARLAASDDISMKFFSHARSRAACCRWWLEPTMGDVERYRVEHETRYAYRVPVSQSWQLAHLTPRELPWQHVVSHELRIEPATDERRDAHDSFGNGVTHFAVYGPHPLLRVRMLCRSRSASGPSSRRPSRSPGRRFATRFRGEPAQDDLTPGAR